MSRNGGSAVRLAEPRRTRAFIFRSDLFLPSSLVVRFPKAATFDESVRTRATRVLHRRAYRARRPRSTGSDAEHRRRACRGAVLEAWHARHRIGTSRDAARLAGSRRNSALCALVLHAHGGAAGA